MAAPCTPCASTPKRHGNGPCWTSQQLTTFTHSTKTVQCKGCTNHCQLTINMFDHGRKMISGNKCERIVNPAKFISNPSTLDITAFNRNTWCGSNPLPAHEEKSGFPWG
jgi:hypothetical protein